MQIIFFFLCLSVFGRSHSHTHTILRTTHSLSKWVLISLFQYIFLLLLRWHSEWEQVEWQSGNCVRKRGREKRRWFILLNFHFTSHHIWNVTVAQRAIFNIISRHNTTDAIEHSSPTLSFHFGGARKWILKSLTTRPNDIARARDERKQWMGMMAAYYSNFFFSSDAKWVNAKLPCVFTLAIHSFISHSNTTIYYSFVLGGHTHAVR